MKRYPWLVVGALAVLAAAVAVLAQERPQISRGQSLYVPVYSRLFAGDPSRPLGLVGTLYIRNVDPLATLSVTFIESYDREGRKGRALVARPVDLKPLEIAEYVLPEEVSKGGTGSSLLVRWSSAVPVNAPIVECVMVHARTGEVAFVARAQELADTRK